MHENKHTYIAACSIAFKENESLINSDEESNIENLNDYYLRLIIQMFHVPTPSKIYTKTITWSMVSVCHVYQKTFIN